MVVTCPSAPSPPGGGRPLFLRNQPRRDDPPHFEMVDFRRPLSMPMWRVDSRRQEVEIWREPTIICRIPASPATAAISTAKPLPFPPPASDKSPVELSTSSNSPPFPSPLPSLPNFFKNLLFGDPANKAGPDGTTHDPSDADGVTSPLPSPFPSLPFPSLN